VTTEAGNRCRLRNVFENGTEFDVGFTGHTDPIVFAIKGSDRCHCLPLFSTSAFLLSPSVRTDSNSGCEQADHDTKGNCRPWLYPPRSTSAGLVWVHAPACVVGIANAASVEQPCE
jgi:hypothetical protein